MFKVAKEDFMFKSINVEDKTSFMPTKTETGFVTVKSPY